MATSRFICGREKEIIIMNDLKKFSLNDIKQDVIKSHRECTERGLLQSAKWAAEMNYALDEVAITAPTFTPQEDQEFICDYDHFTLAKSYFDLKEYDRASHFVQNCKSAKAYFLHMYARYLGAEKRRLDDATEPINAHNGQHIEHLKSLRQELHLKYKDDQLDGYTLYLYGIVLRKLDLLDDARRVLVEAVSAEPLVWSAWQELTLLITDKDMIQSLPVPEHWMRLFFLAHASLELQLNEEARQHYVTLRDNGFSKSTYVLSQIAMSYHNMREVDEAVAAFANLQKIDPYRLDNVDTYSNLLYVKEMRTELAYLAHECCDIDKYRVETCTVIGNYYSLRGQHEKAVLYFQRALKLNPSYLSAWTLMGHEYMELKNTCAAIQAYRTALEVNKRDYRAFYGLGQTYEILKMPLYSLYYYRQAQVLRPNDSRMLAAMGEAYEKLDRLQEAKKCFFKAHSVGDVEGLALCKLAKVFEKLNEEDEAAGAYVEFINETEIQGAVHTNSLEDVANAYKYLAYYYLRNKRLDEAYDAAQKCAEYPETREEGKGLLRQISEQRSKGGGDTDTPNLDGMASVGPEHTMPASVLAQSGTPLNQLSPIHLTYTP